MSLPGKPSGPGAAADDGVGRVRPSAQQRRLLLESLASSLEAGLAADSALHTWARVQPAGAPAARAATAAAERLAEGATLHEALADAGLADRSQAALIRAAERAGHVPATLQEVATEIRAARQQLRALAGALAYPVFLLLVALVVLPLPTLVTEGLGAYLGTVLPPLVVAGGVAAALVWAVRTGRLTAARLLAPTRRLPVLSGFHREVAAGRTCRVLGRTLAAGLPADDALAAAGEALPYPDQRLAMERSRRAVAGGASLTDALQRAALLPPDTLAAVATAEAAGSLDRVLAERADTHRDASVRRARAIGAGLAALVGLGVMVGLAAAILMRYLALLPGLGGEALPPELRDVMR